MKSTVRRLTRAIVPGTTAAGCLAVLLAASAGSVIGGADDQPQTVLKRESFDKDPGWEGVNNRLVPEKMPTITQNFGYSATRFAAKEKGEVGGTLRRATVPAWYADKIKDKTLDDKLSASRTFAITKPGSGRVFFGWFNSQQTEGTARAVGALGLEIGTSKGGGRLHVRLHTARNQSCGTLIQPAGEKKDRTLLRIDGTRYTWKLDYDPQANAGKGRITFTIHSNLAAPEPFEQKTYTVDLPDGYRRQGTVFDRFGLMNGTKPGGQTTIYFGDLEYDGHVPDLSKDPGWEGVGNRDTYTAKQVAGAQDFGYRNTARAGGRAGEIGGTFWRDGNRWGYYADKVGPLALDDRLEAGGKVLLEVGAPDSGMYFGWFRSGTKDAAPDRAGNFLGVKVAGPSRAGHYLQPAYTTAKGTARVAGKGPVLVPGKPYDWSLVYEPSANDGRGRLRVTLGGESFTLDVKKGDRAEGARFDRFGLFSLHNQGGHGQVKIYFDDLKYTVAGPTR